MQYTVHCQTKSSQPTRRRRTTQTNKKRRKKNKRRVMPSAKISSKNLDGHPHSTAAVSASDSVEAVWYCKTAPKTWTRYSDNDSETLETAFRKKNNGTNKLQVPVVGGSYTVNLLQLLQYKADDALRQRPVKRVIEKKRVGEGGEKSKADPPLEIMGDERPNRKKSRTVSPARAVALSNSAIGGDTASNSDEAVHKKAGGEEKSKEEGHGSVSSGPHGHNPYASFLTAATTSATGSEAAAAHDQSAATNDGTDDSDCEEQIVASTTANKKSPNKGTTTTTTTTTASTTLFSSRAEEASKTMDAESERLGHGPMAKTILFERFAKSIFHVIAPTPNLASLQKHSGDALTLKLFSADMSQTTDSPSSPVAGTSSSAAGASGVYVPAAASGVVSSKHKTNSSGATAECFTMLADADYRSQLQLFSRILKKVPLINRSSLADSAEKCRPDTRNWLKEIGRLPKYKGVFLLLKAPLKDMPASMPVTLTPRYKTNVGHLQSLANRSHFTLVGGTQFQRTGSMTDVANPDSVLIPCMSSAKIDPLSDRDHLQTQLMLLSGPVLMCVDNDFSPVAKPPELIACSIPGINFAYSAADQKAFCVLKDPAAGTGGGYIINEAKAVERMRLIWAHTLAVMDAVHGVQIACLCAIGCGAFKGYFGSQVPRLWGRALAMALTHFKQDPRNASKFLPTVYDVSPYSSEGSSACGKGPTSRGVFHTLESIVVSLPTFGADNNFIAFSVGLRTCLREISAATGIINLGHLPVLLAEDLSMTTTAAYCASVEKKRVGILNPSDVQAIRHGWVGMYWDGGHVALEELLAMTTTLLVQHVGLDKDLYTNGARRSIVSL